jgi:hypothetical protein
MQTAIETSSPRGRKRVVEIIPEAKPVTIRLPKIGQTCPWTGFSRAKLNELVLPTEQNQFSPPVVSYVIKERKENKTGIRLIDFQSLMGYVRQHRQPSGVGV